jgi:formate dehydrogenase gamma subunit
MAEQKEYLRFSVPQRLEHWVLVISFTALVFTGIPQKFAGTDWAETAIGWMGGIERVRIIHHTAAVILILTAIYHVIAVAYKVFVLRVRWTMFPRLDDVLDALDTIRYNLGLTKDSPKLDRYNFVEKVEYWALVWGTVIMGITGLAMWNPITFTRFFPGDLIPAAKAAHGAEAILAALAIVIWHFYNVHLKHFSKAMFTGKVSEHQMQEEHALELERIKQGKTDPRPAPEVIKQRERVFIPVATFAAVGMLIALYFATTYQVGTLETVARQPQQQIQIYVPITPTPTLVPGASPAPTGVAAAVPLPADHAGRTTCLACHGNGVGPALPADHAGRTDATCAACHKVSGAPAAQPTAAPTTGASGTTAAPTTAPAASGLQPLPADHAGRTICLACHANNVGPALPADHAGRTDAMCSACHKTASTPAAPPTTTSATSVPAASPTAPASSSASGPMPQPADHAGRTTCLACHANLSNPALPADHAGRTDATCAACHKAP